MIEMTHRTQDEERLVQVFERLGFKRERFSRPGENAILMALLQENQGRYFFHFEAIIDGGILTIKVFASNSTTELVVEFEPFRTWGKSTPSPMIAPAIIGAFPEAIQLQGMIRFRVPRILQLDRGRVEYLHFCPVAPGGGPSMLGI